MNILIKTVPHSDQRYDTVGDWQLSGDDITITVSETGDWRYDAAIALHELVEVLLCKDRGISQEQVDDFDTKFEEQRKEGDTSEPGDDPLAPYHVQHGFATGIERLFIAALDTTWRAYEGTLNKL